MKKVAEMAIAVDCGEYEIERIELYTNQVDLTCETLDEVLNTISDMSGKKIWEQDDLPKEAVRQNLSNEVFRPIAIGVVLENGVHLDFPFVPEKGKENYNLSAWHFSCPEEDEDSGDYYDPPGEVKGPSPLELAFIFDEYEKVGKLPEFFELLESGELGEARRSG